MPSARSRSPPDGCLSSPPPGSRTTGGSSPPPGASSCQVNGSRFARATSIRRNVASEERGPTISMPMPSHALQRLAAGDEGREHQIAQRAVLEQQPAQDVTVDRDVPQRLRHDRGHEDGLPGEEVQLAEEARGAVTEDLVAGGVEDRHLALPDRDEGVRRVADAVEDVADRRRALLAHCRRASRAALAKGRERQGAERPSGESNGAPTLCVGARASNRRVRRSVRP